MFVSYYCLPFYDNWYQSINQPINITVLYMYIMLLITNDGEILSLLYYSMRNFCNLIGLEQLYFSLI